MKKNTAVLLSPLIIIIVNVIVALIAGHYIGKWAFIPIILIEWVLFLFFIFQYAYKGQLKRWLKPSFGGWGWKLLSLIIALGPLPIFLKHHHLLSNWEIIAPWIILALLNPWLEEFYWRGLLGDYTKKWGASLSIVFTSGLFALNHAVFGINSELFSGYTVIISTFIMGVVWGATYRSTNSLRWVIFAHFLVDLFNLSSVAFLDLFKSGW